VAVTTAVRRGFDIRRVNHRDRATAEVLTEVMHAAYRLEARKLGVDTFPPLARGPDDVAASANDFYASFGPGGLLGVLEIEPDPAESAATIASLAVLPEHAAHGHGTALVEFAIALPFALLRVSTGTHNEPALKLYERAGFVARDWESSPEGIRRVRLERRA
jgi:ribosomal protein S18 acetylase RimI-like enzyme